ncbi:MAG: hypothetical protein P8J87_18430, partial [Verrucomicrobiales bacterium]|nr:hypothetical protein [Verrucomicrobiales bacterium]
MKQSLQSLLLPAIVASALVTAWFDSFLIPSWVLVISATVSLAVWLCFRPGASSRQRSGNRSSLLPLVAVATVILVSMMNPSH